jgi:hypothetical protein
VNGHAAGVEHPRSVRVLGAGQFVGQVGVLDHLELAVHRHEIPNLLQVVGLGHRDARHLGLFKIVQPDEQRIDRRDQRIVHLKIAEHSDPAAGQIIQHAAIRQRGQTPPVPVGRKRHAVPISEQNPPVGVDRGHHPLLKEGDLTGIETEMVFLREVRPGGCIGRFAGHHVPGERAVVARLGGAEVLGEELKQRLVADRPDGKHAFGLVKPQAGALPPRHHHRRNFALRDQRPPALPGLLVVGPASIVRLGREHVGGGDPLALGDRHRIGALLSQPADGREIDPGHVAQQQRPLVRVKRIPVVKKVLLVEISRALAQNIVGRRFAGRHGSFHIAIENWVEVSWSRSAPSADTL